MQTFLPYPDFKMSAACLDDKRLGKQRVECLQILRCLSGITKGWRNHPAVKMWHPYVGYLNLYGKAICKEWIKRGFKDTCLQKIVQATIAFGPYAYKYGKPAWLGDPTFHASHRSNLLRKNPEHYGRFGWTEPDDLPYVWPVRKDET